MLHECIIGKIRYIINRLDEIIFRLKKIYKILYVKMLISDRTSKQIFANEMHEVRQIVRKLMIVQISLELIQRYQIIPYDLLVIIEKMLKPLSMKLYLELKILEDVAEKATNVTKTLMAEATRIAEERIKLWAEN